MQELKKDNSKRGSVFKTFAKNLKMMQFKKFTARKKTMNKDQGAHTKFQKKKTS